MSNIVHMSGFLAMLYILTPYFPIPTKRKKHEIRLNKI